MNFIDQFAQHYGLHPDEVYATTKFGTLTEMTIKWRKFFAFDKKYNEIKSGFNNATKNAG